MDETIPTKWDDTASPLIGFARRYGRSWMGAIGALFIGVSSWAADVRHPFFAMDTIARGGPDVVVPMLKDLGYDGLGGSAGDAAMARALEAVGLKFFNGYFTIDLKAESSALDDRMRAVIDAMGGHDAALWMAVAAITENGKRLEKSAEAADEIAVKRIREMAEYAELKRVKIALYPHTGFWIERVDDALGIADRVDRASVGVTFNLCHWLKVEGSEADPEPVISKALPRLMFVTINGADGGDTRQLGWDRLIQPLDRGSYDLSGFLAKVDRAGYRGPIGFQGYGIQGDPREILARTLAAWKKLTNQAK